MDLNGKVNTVEKVERLGAQRVLGSWNWFLLLNKIAFSVLDECYTLSRYSAETCVPTCEAYNELLLLMTLSPLL